MKSEKQKEKKRSFPYFVTFLLLFSIFHLPFFDFPSFLLHFPFFPCISFPNRSAEISQWEVLGGIVPPTCYATAEDSVIIHVILSLNRDVICQEISWTKQKKKKKKNVSGNASFSKEVVKSKNQTIFKISGWLLVVRRPTMLYIWRADFQNLLHPLLHVTHLQLRSQQKSQFSTQNLLQMENVDTNWNLE